MKQTLHSMIGSAIVISMTLPALHSQTSTPAAAPAPAEAPAAAPATPAAAPAAPAAAPAAAPVAKSSTKKTRLDKKVARVSAAVGLDADQQVKLKAIYVEEEGQIKAVKADKTLTAAQTTAKVTAIRDAADAKVVDILTPDQKQKYTDYKHHKTPAAQ